MPQNKEIFLISPSFPPGTGGIQTWMKNWVKNSEHDFTVLTQKAEDTSFDEQVEAEITRDNILGPVGYLKTAWYAIKNRDKHIHLESPMNAFTVIPAKLLGAQITSHAHGNELIYHENGAGKIRRLLFQQGLKTISKFVVPSEWTREKLRELGVDEDKIEVIHPGIDFEKFNYFELEERKYSSEDKFTLLTVGRLDERKGHKLVLEAIKDIEDVEYLIAGSGEMEEEIKQKIQQLKLEDKVEVLGYVPEEDLVKLYHESDCFIMTSTKTQNSIEGFGIVYLEANAADKSVIGADTGGTPSAIKNGETGLLTSTDSGEIRQEIREIQDNPEKFSGEAVEWARKHDWQNQIAFLDRSLDLGH
jgi:phosphatidylinositol alpha-1,6-mannosyltransferase